ncbi:MAG: FTR1 family protein [Gammaproteobacteria bacterium]|jgi:high-affinity iron transporter
MLLTSVVIVLREVLEAALLISILSALSVAQGIGRGWIGWALAGGLVAALGLGYGIDTISNLFAGVGQEVSSASLQIVIYLALVLLLFLIGWPAADGQRVTPVLPVIMAAIVMLAIAREGSEVLVYLLGFAGNLKQLLVVLVGSAIGAGIGISVGVLIYYLLRSMPRKPSQIASLLLLVLVAAGLVSQAALLLIQADWLPAQLPVWDSSALIAEDSVTGQLLYALVGYEATPTAIQAGCYFGGALLMLLAGAGSAFRRRRLRSGIRGGHEQ